MDINGDIIPKLDIGCDNPIGDNQCEKAFWLHNCLKSNDQEVSLRFSPQRQILLIVSIPVIALSAYLSVGVYRRNKEEIKKIAKAYFIHDCLLII